MKKERKGERERVSERKKYERGKKEGKKFKSILWKKEGRDKKERRGSLAYLGGCEKWNEGVNEKNRLKS